METSFAEADPLLCYLEAALLPEMEFVEASLEDVVECLRHTARKALATAQFPVPGGVSITVVASPAQRAQPLSLHVTEGMSLHDALVALIVAADLDMVVGAVGLLLCARELGDFIDEWFHRPAAVVPEQPLRLGTLPRAVWLRLLAFHPVLAITCHPLRQAWMDAFIASDGTPETAYTLANSIVGTVKDNPCAPLAQIPLYLPDIE